MAKNNFYWKSVLCREQIFVVLFVQIAFDYGEKQIPNREFYGCSYID